MAGNQSFENNSDFMAAVTTQVLTSLVERGLINPQKNKRKRVEWESKLTREYLQAAFPYSLKWFRKEIGPLPKEGDPYLMSRTRRWADAIVLHEGDIIIIETKMKPSLNAVSQLYGYGQLFPETPEFSTLRDLPIRLQLLCAMYSQEVEKLAIDWGLEFVTFQPSFFEEYKQLYITRELFVKE